MPHRQAETRLFVHHRGAVELPFLGRKTQLIARTGGCCAARQAHVGRFGGRQAQQAAELVQVLGGHQLWCGGGTGKGLVGVDQVAHHVFVVAIDVGVVGQAELLLHGVSDAGG